MSNLVNETETLKKGKVHNLKINLKKATTLLMTALMSLTLAACGAGDSKTTAKQGKDGENSSKSKILVAYFSRADENYGVGVIEKGNTRILAEMIAEKTGADLFEIKPVKAYPKEYTPATQVAKVEKEQNARPEIEGPLPDMSKYDTVFIGYPIWWSDLPMPVYTFIDKENFVGKTVIPFCTHEGSGIGSTERFIADTTKAKTLEGLEMRGATAQNSPEEAKAEVLKWLKKLGY